MKAKSVSLKNTTKIFDQDSQKPVYAVDNINLEIKEGEFVTLLGPSGCGKTTTLRMIAGFEEISEGEIYFGDENVNQIPPNKRDCTMVFQSYALFPHLNVFENVAYGLRLKKTPKNIIEEKISKIFSIMGLEDYKDRMPRQLSGGQQQRIALARALVMEPGVLLFDEPLSNLDAKLRLVMRDEIRKVQKEVGITAIYVTHDQNEAMAMSDKVVVMNKGKIEQIGSPQEIYQKPKTMFVADFIGVANFVDGVVTEIGKDHMIVRVGESTLKTDKIDRVQENQRVTVVIRPESIHLTEGNANVGVVTKSIFMGQHQEYDVEFMGKKFQITQGNPAAHQVFKEGQKVSLKFSSVHIITE